MVGRDGVESYPDYRDHYPAVAKVNMPVTLTGRGQNQ